MWKSMALAMALVLGATVNAAEIKSGESVAFLGDSITNYGWGEAGGYIRLCESAFTTNGLKIKIFPKGIGGNKSTQMLARLDKDIISNKPTYMTLSCGVNDVWHGKNGVKLEDYKKNITQIVDKAQAAGIKVIILTATIFENAGKTDSKNDQLAPYNAFLHDLAQQKNCKLADLNADMWKALETLRPQCPNGNILTRDGVHMLYPGNKIMAEGVLKALGFTDEELAKAAAQWETLKLGPKFFDMTTAEYLKISEKAFAKKIAPAKLIQNTAYAAGKAAVKKLVK